MPLRDHFHSPITKHYSWNSLHVAWSAMMIKQLNAHLPKQYLATPKLYLGGEDTEVRNVEEFESQTTTGIEEPTFRGATDLFDIDECAVRIHDSARGQRLVATVEFVNPSNKRRPSQRQAFAIKCFGLFQQGVSVTIVDIVTPCEHNLYSEWLKHYGLVDNTLGGPPTPIYAVTCRRVMPRQRYYLEAWHQPLVLNQPLPTLPIWLQTDLAMPLDLEACYEDACRLLRIT